MEDLCRWIRDSGVSAAEVAWPRTANFLYPDLVKVESCRGRWPAARAQSGDSILANSTQPIVDFAAFEVGDVIADKATVQQFIPQRFEMSQLDGILYEDAKSMRAVGFKDVGRDEFWVRGHMPDFPLMPGVIMCESAAQLIAYMARKFDLSVSGIMGFGGLDKVRFRRTVVPGDRLIVMVHFRKMRPNVMVICDFQGFVDRQLVVDGEIRGVVISPGQSPE
jgi:3-hydroxyacyl-[acyl-carrier-protein] dehydratase